VSAAARESIWEQSRSKQQQTQTTPYFLGEQPIAVCIEQAEEPFMRLHVLPMTPPIAEVFSQPPKPTYAEKNVEARQVWPAHVSEPRKLRQAKGCQERQSSHDVFLVFESKEGHGGAHQDGDNKACCTPRPDSEYPLSHAADKLVSRDALGGLSLELRHALVRILNVVGHGLRMGSAHGAQEAQRAGVDAQIHVEHRHGVTARVTAVTRARVCELERLQADARENAPGAQAQHHRNGNDN
jgi:hypothetical protein